MSGRKGSAAAMVVDEREALDGFRKANDELDYGAYLTKTIFTTLHYAALWQKENPDEDEALDEGICWMTVLDYQVKDAFTRLTAWISDFEQYAQSVAQTISQERRREIDKGLQTLYTTTDKLQTLIAFFAEAAEYEAQSGHSKEINWPGAFEIILDYFPVIQNATARTWNAISPEQAHA
jgi:hypothetical protein